MMGKEAEILYYFVFEHLYRASHFSKPSRALKSSY